MKRISILAAASVAFLVLSGCGTTSIYDRERPDEFAVSRSKPIEVPKNFTLPTPTPNAPRPQDGDTKQQVLDAMFGGAAPATAPRP
ncbi:DUF3035 domain-containing protein [Sphingorhabdus wooponensis]|jgi:uncharacterized lipoprotein|uniref:DUF3035 domain-containing protein n=1 Tax=Sphingorhabdus wooponensis TaxID=940136 RepID=A0A3R8Q7I7_9SPHN|nr:DUF3035 domain-containing protein [Sphingorhabdus wooponensis]RRQ51381.1 DUF3035 domain-containing protein [Sphingorhabdus wooponensis]